MSSLASLRNELNIVNELGEISEVMEQVAAKTIIETRSNILKNRDFFNEAWIIYNTLRKLTNLGPDVYHKDLVIIMTPNRGMCGMLMNKVIQEGERLQKTHQADILITGKKGHNYFRARDEKTIHFFSVPNDATYTSLEPLKEIIAKYACVYIVFPRYYSISKQQVEVVSLQSSKDEMEAEPDSSENFKIDPAKFLIEPDIETVVNYLNKTIIGILFFSYFSESLLAYNAAQMLAMHDAHDNAKEEIKALNFRFNKLKREIVDSKMRDLYKFKYITR